MKRALVEAADDLDLDLFVKTDHFSYLFKNQTSTRSARAGYLWDFFQRTQIVRSRGSLASFLH